MMRWLFRLFACRHHEMIRERDDAGVLWLACTSCRHKVAIQLSDRVKVRRLVKQWAKSRKQTTGPTVKAPVYVMPKRGKERA